MKTIRCIIIILFLVAVFNNQEVLAKEEAQTKKLIIIVVPDFSFQEVLWLREKGNVPLVWENGAMAAMNIRPDGQYSYLNNMVSISLGVRGVGVEGWNGFMKGEEENGITIDKLYKQWTGKTVDEQKIFHPLLHKLVDKNIQSTYRGEVGILGEILKENEISTYVIGNSDFLNEKIRYAPLLTMDIDGLALGNFLLGIKEVEGAPSGFEMDSDNILQHLSMAEERSLTIIEWGDLFRLYKQKANMSEDYFEKRYSQTLLQLENVIQNLTGNNNDFDVMLLSPMVHNEAYQNKERLAPFFYWAAHNGINYLYSSTTRQSFLISNLDVAPSILDYFNIQSTNFSAKPLIVSEVTGINHRQGLQEIYLMFQVYKTRNVILSSYITLLVLLLIAVSIVIVMKEKKDKWVIAAKVLLVSGISSPIWLLITPYLLNYLQPNLYLLGLLIISFLTGWTFQRYFRNPIFIVSVILFSTITIDLMIGSYLMKRSYLGYDPVIGARYYGIGNEYAGVYLISGLLLFQKSMIRKLYVLPLVVIGQIILLSSTSLGANAGATLSAGIMFAYFCVKEFFPNLALKKLIVSGILIIPILLITLYITQLNGEQSHISYAFTKMFSGDFLFIVDTIKRKLEMNWKIFRYSNWTQLFVTTYFLIVMYLWWSKRLVQDKTRKLIIQTGVVASLALLFLNDSGVVAAATSMFIIVCTSYYWALEKQEKGEH